MKKTLVTVMAAILTIAVCGCNGNEENSVSEDETNLVSSQSITDSSENHTVQASVINKNETKSVSIPSGSISFEEACAILDQRGMKDLELPQSVKDYEKYYFGTVDYYGKQYYSIYLYAENNGKKVFVGNNILVACDGETVLKKNWLGYYEEVNDNGAQLDQSLEELYPSAKTTPVEAAKVLADKNLGLEYNLSQYIFEFSDETVDIQSINCFVVTPKVEFTDSVKLYKKLYINTDGSGQVFQSDPDEKNEYIELK